MENQKANKLVDKILKDLDESGINKEALIDDIKELRTYALEEQIPLVVKVLRLTYEHLEENSTFLIPILDDEPLEDEEEGAEAVNDLDTPVESLKYLIALTKNLNNKGNIADLREYKELFARY
ncbi:hypothetical protein [Algibacter lectus]|uniref:Uncharacterized protein n=1 Tax=Algibacter lectus TaxID=221126 RepID=A0A090WQN5_9FLAO|nr:hypothetical protein [Algibacter lectus]MDO7135508.1 hypothetical protein [Algibacter lectus]MWW24938.1 hypothetical protein [Algibacter lectus]TDY64651.1 hypothetical protein DFQ06_1568 [Algibacter lectus]SFD22084.1 hypothetical protein SAMN04489722_106111 [Algibacter lectus]GAL61349.1 hypothetical protein JCM19300_4295 [Algibacter lectus]